ncbi:MAG: dUTP diphosphatase [Thermodesulfobacteriota bacterium]
MDENPVIKLVKLRPERDKDIPLPKYMTPSSSGMDICAAIEREMIINPGEIALIPSGFAVSIPTGYEAQIRPRSGLAVRYGIGIINSPGTIDSDYRGEIKVAVINWGQNPFTFYRGDRVAQMVIQRVYQVKIELTEHLDETIRNSGGFGHTGVS